MTSKVISAYTIAMILALGPHATLAAAPRDPAAQKMENELQQIKAEMQRQSRKIDRMDIEKLTSLVYKVNAENQRLAGIIKAIEKEVYPKLAALSKDVDALERDQRFEDIRQRMDNARKERLQAYQERKQAARERNSLKGRVDSIVKQLRKLLSGFVAPN